MKYLIPEFNMKKLERKLKRINNKCNKYGVDFKFEILGEQMKRVKQENEYQIVEALVKFYEIETEGSYVIDGWQYIATIEHGENGNIIKGVSSEVEIPKRFYDCKPYCEHCKTYRNRAITYIIAKDGEFKQIGKSCLANYTGVLNAELVAEFCEYFTLLKNSEDYESIPGNFSSKYQDIETVLSVAYEFIKEYGYVKSGHIDSTKDMVYEELVNNRNIKVKNVEYIKAAIDWAKQLKPDNEYMNNLKVLCSNDYVEWQNIGILVSLLPTYEKYLLIEKQKQSECKSEYIGNVKERISLNVKKMLIMTSWYTNFGVNYVYKIIDTEGNVFTWKTNNLIDCEYVTKIKGTVKSHREYTGIKQTELTRCKCL